MLEVFTNDHNEDDPRCACLWYRMHSSIYIQDAGIESVPWSRVQLQAHPALATFTLVSSRRVLGFLLNQVTVILEIFLT